MNTSDIAAIRLLADHPDTSSAARAALLALAAENERLHRQNAALLAAKQRAEASEKEVFAQARAALTPPDFNTDKSLN